MKKIRTVAASLALACVTSPLAALADSCQFSNEGLPDPHPLGAWQARCTTTQAYQCSLFHGAPKEHEQIIYVLTPPGDTKDIATDPNELDLSLESPGIESGTPRLFVDGKPLPERQYVASDPAFHEVIFKLKRRTPIFASSHVRVAIGSWQHDYDFASRGTADAVHTIVNCAMTYKP